MSRAIIQSSEKEYSAELENLRNNSTGKVIITSINDKKLAFLIADNKVKCITSVEESYIYPEDIVIAVIRDIKKDIDAAFIEIGENFEGYLPLKNVPDSLKIKQGDLIPVQIISQPQKGKRARFTAKIDYSKYEDHDELQNKAQHLCKYNFLYRSNDHISYKLEKVFIKDSYDEIITDDKNVYDKLALKYQNLRLYNDTSFDLSKLYSLEKALNEALSQKVWLDCGGYLIFNKTEALTVIDVNSGKFKPSKGTSSEEAFLKVNTEAAVEICRQLRIRNISGIIIIDFINLKDKTHQESILDSLKNASSEDNIQVNVIDITALGLVEMTRKKEFPSLYEEIFNK